jgi:hypothetical protein
VKKTTSKQSGEDDGEERDSGINKIKCPCNSC